MTQLPATSVGATAADLAGAVRAGAVDPVEVVEAHLAHIERADERIGAFQLVRRERVLAEARALAARDDLAELTLAGVPVAIKDNVPVAGEPTREGTLVTPDEPAPADHEVVRRIRAAGALIVGKTRVPELCTFGATDSPFGVTRNPWKLDRTSGGSSGGSAAAVASAMVPLAHANDGMGSIRIPSACCGVFGIKPGAGLVPVDLGESDWYGLSENGSIASVVGDAALLLAVMAGRPELAAPSPTERRLRVALSTKPPLAGLPVDRQFQRAVVETGELLARAGHLVEPADPPYSVRHGAAALARWFAGVDDEAAHLGRDRLQRRNRRHAALGRAVKARGWVGPSGRAAWRETLAPFFERFDVVVTPALARPPIAAAEWHKRSWTANITANALYAPFAAPWNLAGFPAAVVPAGVHSEGTPLAVQLIAQAGQEGRVLAVARLLEELRPWARHAPGIEAG